MSSFTARAVHDLSHDEDPKEKLNKSLEGYISEYEPFWDEVIVAIYVRPTKTKSGLYLSAKAEEEDVYQGDVGLVVKMGPDAEKLNMFKVGDWVRFRPSEGERMSVGGVQCRSFEAASIRGRLTNPDVVY